MCVISLLERGNIPGIRPIPGVDHRIGLAGLFSELVAHTERGNDRQPVFFRETDGPAVLRRIVIVGIGDRDATLVVAVAQVLHVADVITAKIESPPQVLAPPEIVLPILAEPIEAVVTDVVQSKSFVGLIDDEEAPVDGDVAEIQSGVDECARTGDSLVAEPQVRAAISALDVGEFVFIDFFPEERVVREEE